jgi:hypothetical protein
MTQLTRSQDVIAAHFRVRRKHIREWCGPSSPSRAHARAHTRSPQRRPVGVGRPAHARVPHRLDVDRGHVARGPPVQRWARAGGRHAVHAAAHGGERRLGPRRAARAGGAALAAGRRVGAARAGQGRDGPARRVRQAGGGGRAVVVRGS